MSLIPNFDITTLPISSVSKGYGVFSSDIVQAIGAGTLLTFNNGNIPSVDIAGGAGSQIVLANSGLYLISLIFSWGEGVPPPPAGWNRIIVQPLQNGNLIPFAGRQTYQEVVSPPPHPILTQEMTWILPFNALDIVEFELTYTGGGVIEVQGNAFFPSATVSLLQIA